MLCPLPLRLRVPRHWGGESVVGSGDDGKSELLECECERLRITRAGRSDSLVTWSRRAAPHLVLAPARRGRGERGEPRGISRREGDGDGVDLVSLADMVRKREEHRAANRLATPLV